MNLTVCGSRTVASSRYDVPNLYGCVTGQKILDLISYHTVRHRTACWSLWIVAPAYLFTKSLLPLLLCHFYLFYSVTSTSFTKSLLPLLLCHFYLFYKVSSTSFPYSITVPEPEPVRLSCSTERTVDVRTAAARSEQLRPTGESESTHCTYSVPGDTAYWILHSILTQCTVSAMLD